MEKLDFKYISPYLPYGLEFVCVDRESTEYEIACASSVHLANEIIDVCGVDYDFSDLGGKEIKPLLRPLFDLTKNDLKEKLYQYYESLGIDIKLVKYDSGNDNPFDMTLTATYKLMDDVFTDVLIERGSTSETPYHIFSWLCEKHFDVFGLIKKGLAKDINTI